MLKAASLEKERLVDQRSRQRKKHRPHLSRKPWGAFLGLSGFGAVWGGGGLRAQDIDQTERSCKLPAS